MTTSPTLSNLLDDAALLSMEYQWHSIDVLGEHSWRMDMAEGVFWFDGAVPRRSTDVHFLGTAAPGPRSWLWSWASPSNEYAPQVQHLAESVRDFGIRHDITLLTSGEIPFAAMPGTPTSPTLAAFTIIDAAKVVADNWVGYTCDLGRGTRAAFIVEHPEFRLPPATPERIMRVLRAFATTPSPRITDHRRALLAYGARRGLGVAFNREGSLARVTAEQVDFVIGFRDDGVPTEMTSAPAI